MSLSAIFPSTLRRAGCRGCCCFKRFTKKKKKVLRESSEQDGFCRPLAIGCVDGSQELNFSGLERHGSQLECESGSSELTSPT